MWERSNGKWLESKVLECVQERKRDKTTYRDLHKATGIPVGTLWNK